MGGREEMVKENTHPGLLPTGRTLKVTGRQAGGGIAGGTRRVDVLEMGNFLRFRGNDFK